MRLRSWAIVGTLFVGLGACQTDFRDEPTRCETPACRYQKELAEAASKLDDFGGETAAEAYQRAAELAEANGFDLCTPLYGEMLARVQQAVSVLNRLIQGVVEGLAGGAGGVLPSADEGLFTIELGSWITNYYTANFREPFERISLVAERLLTEERFVDCVFEYPDGVPFRLGSNEDIESLRRNAPDAAAAEIRIGERWDRVEARLLKWLVDDLIGLFYFWMAHEIEINDQQMAQLIGKFSKDFLVNITACYDGTHPVYGQPIDRAEEEAAGSSFVDGIVNQPVECLRVSPNPKYHFVKLLRSFGWLVGDNPRTLASSPERWDRYMPLVDDRLATGWGALVPLFDTMVQRTVRHAGDFQPEVVLGSYAFAYDDADFSGTVNRGDAFSLNVVGVKLKLPRAFADQTTAIENLAETVISSFLGIRVSEDRLISLWQQIFENLSSQFVAVDDPTVAHEPLRFADFYPLLSATSIFDADNPPPPAIALDFTAFFTDPVSVRTFFPYWEAVTSTTFGDYVNEFVIEEELPTNVTTTAFPWQVTTALGDASHFDPNGYLALDPATSPEQPSVRIPGTSIPRDCFLADDQPQTLLDDLVAGSGFLVPAQGLLYFYLQDPSFHGLLLVDSSKLAAYRAAGCTPGGADTTDFVPANLYTFHAAGIAYWRWFNEAFTLGELLNLVQGGG